MLAATPKTTRCRECGQYHGALDPHPPPLGTSSTGDKLTDEVEVRQRRKIAKAEADGYASTGIVVGGELLMRAPPRELTDEHRPNTMTAVLGNAATITHTPAVSSVELTDEQADWLISRLEWTAGLHVGLSAEFRMAFGVGVELGVREEYREGARAAVRRIARLG